jgi:hypothetical protein
MKINKLAYYLTRNIMIFHDTANYTGLKKNSELLLKEMGYNAKTTLEIAENIKQIYIFYDKAQKAYEMNNPKLETSNYIISKKFAKKINDLSAGNSDSRLLVDIVIAWRHKNKFLALYQIFRYWKSLLSLFPALQCTFLQLKAGLSHDSRSSKEFQNNFSKIYSILVDNKQLPILF